jgi:putative hydrolase of the HAD superfamily
LAGVIRALMLDVDGVLVRGRPADGRAWASGLETDLGVSAEALHHGFFAPHWDEIVVGRAGLMERLGPALAVIAPGVSAERLVEYWFGQDAQLDEGVLADVAALRARGVAVHLATNQEHLLAGYLMGRLGLGGRVDGIQYSAALGARKPEGAFFARAAAAVGAAPGELMLVDDTAANVEAARAAGWLARHWTGEVRLTELARG